jgi:hypothetical protein
MAAAERSTIYPAGTRWSCGCSVCRRWCTGQAIRSLAVKIVRGKSLLGVGHGFMLEAMPAEALDALFTSLARARRSH